MNISALFFYASLLRGLPEVHHLSLGEAAHHAALQASLKLSLSLAQKVDESGLVVQERKAIVHSHAKDLEVGEVQATVPAQPNGLTATHHDWKESTSARMVVMSF